ncbi:MAG: HAD family hydrolase [Porcipelethomonas sp.]
MSRYKLVIFDLDGTIADTSPGIFNSVRYVRKMMDLCDITEEQMRSHVGPPMEESYSKNFGLSGDALRQAVEYHKEYALKQGYKEIEIYPGMFELLNELKDNNVKTAIATLKANETAQKIFIDTKLNGMFDFILGSDTSAPMTKAQMIERCVKEFGVEKSECVLIGDSKYDAIGAEEAGIDFIAVTYGFGFKEGMSIDYPNVGIASSCFNIIDLIS